jgi:hypothetical protein
MQPAGPGLRTRPSYPDLCRLILDYTPLPVAGQAEMLTCGMNASMQFMAKLCRV